MIDYDTTKDISKDTIVECSIPVKWTTWDKKTYTGWLVKAKDMGWFRSTDPKWETQQLIIRKEKEKR